MTEPLVRVRDLTRVYGEGESRVAAMDGVDLDIADGEFVALMGPSGSGKSTLLNTLGCLDLPTTGTYHLGGVELTSLTRTDRALVRRAWIGFVFQGFHLLPRLTATANVELPLVYRGLPPDERRSRTEAALEAVGLSHRADHLPSALSGGQQQRVAIARALAIRPKLLLADEPTGNLDTTTSHEVMRLLTSLHEREGITVVMVTHEPEMAAYVRRTVWFRDGRIDRDEVRA